MKHNFCCHRAAAAATEAAVAAVVGAAEAAAVAAVVGAAEAAAVVAAATAAVVAATGHIQLSFLQILRLQPQRNMTTFGQE